MNMSNLEDIGKRVIALASSVYLLQKSNILSSINIGSNSQLSNTAKEAIAISISEYAGYMALDRFFPNQETHQNSIGSDVKQALVNTASNMIVIYAMNNITAIDNIIGYEPNEMKKSLKLGLLYYIIQAVSNQYVKSYFNY